MYHTFIQGSLGAGKTLTMSLLAHHWRQRVRNLGGDIQLFSNYSLKDSSDMLHYSDWYDVAKAQGSICCWDEGQMAFDSRQALKSKSIYATQLLMYVRKMKSIQMYCSPSIMNVDSRIRQVVEVLINVRRNGKKGITLDFFDYQAKQFGANGKFLHSQFLPQYKINQIYKLNLYDTHAMVQGFPLPNTERQAQDFFNQLNEIHNSARQGKELMTV
ncbi:ATPase [Piscibacillus halophilus]|uniref:ATPase n=1 Tax=Piscibacillus halophilus TaxID=571933 RepID=UPI00158C978A|nr:ATPase [Piscibacillus halophilus]